MQLWKQSSKKHDIIENIIIIFAENITIFVRTFNPVWQWAWACFWAGSGTDPVDIGID